jgi:lactoylglutathione lyase
MDQNHASIASNVKQAVPFFGVTNIDASLDFYVRGLNFTMTRYWDPDGRIRWCWLELGGAAVMLQEYWKNGRPGWAPPGTLGHGVSICFMCADAIGIYNASARMIADACVSPMNEAHRRRDRLVLP